MRRLLASVIALMGAVIVVSTVHFTTPVVLGQAGGGPDATVAADSQLPSQALYSWGSNDWGQLANGSSGDGTPTPVTAPTQVAAPTGAVFRTVAAGGAHTLGLTVTGDVYSWGADFSGQLGLGTDRAATTPEAVAIPGGPVVAVAAGSSHSLALTAAGQVYAWGANLFGQLGDGTTTDSDVPVLVSFPGGVRVTAIAAGGDHSLALTSTGQVYGWGANTDGQLGNGSTTSSDQPVLAQAPTGVSLTAIAAGTGHSLALSSGGVAYSWGFNGSGQLGDGTTTDSLTMTAVSMPSDTTFTSIAAGSSHSLALTSAGVVFAWGSNVFGQLDSALVGSLPVDSSVPVQPLGLPPLTTFVTIAAGLNSSYAITSAGVPWVWGGNAYGELGVGSPGLDAALPQAMSTLPPGTLATGLFSGPDASAAFLITRAEQSIAFPALPSPTYGDPPVDVAPVADSGLALTNTATGACAGPLVHLTLAAAGVCALSATQPGNFWFYPATAEASFGVARAPLVIVPDDVTATVGTPPSAFGYQLAGFVNHDPTSVVSGGASCTSPADADSLAGTYPITCTSGTLSAANYIFVASGPGVLTLQAPPSGYAVIGMNGSVWALGPQSATTAPIPPFFGSMAGHPLNAPVVGAAFTPRHDGYWLVASDGGIFTFGSAGFQGSMGGQHLNRPIVGMAATPDGRGYWEVAADGGIFAFGDAAYFGSTGGLNIGQAVVGVAATPTGNGYWITTTSGAVFSFGDAPFEGSLRYINLSAPVVGITTTFDGHGYWLASADGGVFSFGDAAFFGRAAEPPVPIDGII
jgi:alpha-tubulin suppressor-like RCC1 family protein